jgi:hypothetical protein
MNKMEGWNQWAHVDSGIGTPENPSSATHSVFSGYSGFSTGTDYSNDQFQSNDWYQTRQNFRSDEELKQVDNIITQLRQRAKSNPEEIHAILESLEGYLADTDIRCIFLGWDQYFDSKMYYKYCLSNFVSTNGL